MTPLKEIRHSSAHVLATAVLRLFPDAQLDIGPPTGSGFYYDFDLDHKFTADDLANIEAEMKKVIKENQRFERVEVPREEAVQMIKDMGQETYKLGRLNDIPEGDTISFYRNGEFLDLALERTLALLRKSRRSSFYLWPVHITVATRTISSSNASTGQLSPPKASSLNTLNKSRKLARATTDAWVRKWGSFSSTNPSVKGSSYGNPKAITSVQNCRTL